MSLRLLEPGPDLSNVPGNRHLRLLVGCLHLVAEVAESYATSHPPDCECEFCRSHGSADSIWRDVMGASGVNNTLASLLGSDVSGGSDLGGETLGDDLRRLAAWSDQLDALTEAADEAAAVPAIVER